MKLPVAATNVVTPPPSTTRNNNARRDKQTSLDDDASRLLTPCSDDYTASHPHPVSRSPQLPPQLLEDRPAKKLRMTPSDAVSVPPSTPKAGQQLPFFVSDLGNARGLPIPTTPDKKVLPTMSELLATSRRSKARPRPPPRKSQPNVGHSINAQSESRMEKSYISSPTSGSTQATPSAMRYIAQSSPVSPLFTQNPSLFAPPLTSTQPLVNGSPLSRNGHDFRSGATRSTSTKPVAKSQNLMRASSGLVGMAYNSQFDVDKQIDQVADFLDKDVNFDVWIRDPDASQVDSEV